MLPEPCRPAVYQSSTIARSDIGTRAITGHWFTPSGAGAIAMTSCQWLCSAPLMKLQLPLSSMPPSGFGVPLADGLNVPQIRTSGVA